MNYQIKKVDGRFIVKGSDKRAYSDPCKTRQEAAEIMRDLYADMQGERGLAALAEAYAVPTPPTPVADVSGIQAVLGSEKAVRPSVQKSGLQTRNLSPVFVDFFSKSDADDERLVVGYASSERLDSQDEIVDFEAIKAALSDYMEWANVREMHENKAAGTVIKAEPIEGEVKVGSKVITNPLRIEARIFDNDAWEKVKSGVYKGFSIGGKVLNWVTEKIDGKEIKRITSLLLTEISLVDRPANPDAKFLFWKRDMGKGTVDDFAPGATLRFDTPAEAVSFFKELARKSDDGELPDTDSIADFLLGFEKASDDAYITVERQRQSGFATLISGGGEKGVAMKFWLPKNMQKGAMAKAGVSIKDPEEFKRLKAAIDGYDILQAKASRYGITTALAEKLTLTPEDFKAKYGVDAEAYPQVFVIHKPTNRWDKKDGIYVTLKPGWAAAVAAQSAQNFGALGVSGKSAAASLRKEGRAFSSANALAMHEVIKRLAELLQGAGDDVAAQVAALYETDEPEELEAAIKAIMRKVGKGNAFAKSSTDSDSLDPSYSQSAYVYEETFTDASALRSLFQTLGIVGRPEYVKHVKGGGSVVVRILNGLAQWGQKGKPGEDRFYVGMEGTDAKGNVVMEDTSSVTREKIASAIDLPETAEAFGMASNAPFRKAAIESWLASLGADVSRPTPDSANALFEILGNGEIPALAAADYAAHAGIPELTAAQIVALTEKVAGYVNGVLPAYAEGNAPVFKAELAKAARALPADSLPQEVVEEWIAKGTGASLWRGNAAAYAVLVEMADEAMGKWEGESRKQTPNRVEIWQEDYPFGGNTPYFHAYYYDDAPDGDGGLYDTNISGKSAEEVEAKARDFMAVSSVKIVDKRTKKFSRAPFHKADKPKYRGTLEFGKWEADSALDVVEDIDADTNPRVKELLDTLVNTDDGTATLTITFDDEGRYADFRLDEGAKSKSVRVTMGTQKAASFTRLLTAARNNKEARMKKASGKRLLATNKENGDELWVFEDGGVYRVPRSNPRDKNGNPISGRWEASESKVNRFWDAVYSQWWAKKASRASLRKGEPSFTATPKKNFSGVLQSVPLQYGNHKFVYQLKQYTPRGEKEPLFGVDVSMDGEPLHYDSSLYSVDAANGAMRADWKRIANAIDNGEWDTDESSDAYDDWESGVMSGEVDMAARAPFRKSDLHIRPGDLVDFGKHGALYVCKAQGGRLLVTDEEAERGAFDAAGWYLDTNQADSIIERGAAKKATNKQVEKRERAQEPSPEVERLSNKAAQLETELNQKEAVLNQMNSRLEQLESLPMPGGPILRSVTKGLGNNDRVSGVLPTVNDGSQLHDITRLRGLALTEPNPVLRADYTRQLIMAEQAAAARPR